MKWYGHFWVATLIRGAVALLFGCAAIMVPDMASTFLLRPLAIAVAVLFLASYGILDSAIVSVTSFMLPPGAGRIASRVYGVVGVTIGVTLYFAVYDRVQLHWYLYLIAAQAFSIAVSDFFVARHTSRKHGSPLAYAGCIAAAVAAIVYFVIAARSGNNLSAATSAWMIFLYLLVFGMVELLLGGRMLYQELEESRRITAEEVV